MNIQLVVNGVDLVSGYRAIDSHLSENNIKRVCAFLKDAFPVCRIQHGDLCIRVTHGGQDILLAVKTAESYRLFVYNCMAQNLPYMVEATTCNSAWLALCEHLLQTRLDNVFNPDHVLGTIESRAREYGADFDK